METDALKGNMREDRLIYLCRRWEKNTAGFSSAFGSGSQQYGCLCCNRFATTTETQPFGGRSFKPRQRSREASVSQQYSFP